MEFQQTASGDDPDRGLVQVFETTGSVPGTPKSLTDALAAHKDGKVIGWGWDDGRLYVRVAKEEK